jgi:hypothetical protein
MALRRGRNIESLLANRSEDAGSRLSDYGEQGREARVDGRRIREYFTARGKPDNYQYSPAEAREAMNYFKAIDKSKGDWEGTSSPFLQGSGQDYSDLSNPIIKKARDKQLAMIDAQMMDKGSIGEFEGKEIAEMNAVLADPESSPPISKIGSLLSAEGESGLDQAGRDYMDMNERQRTADLYEKNRHLYDRNPGIQNEGNINVGTWDSVARDELAIDIASQDKARLDKILQGKEASMADFKGEEEGEESWWKGLFSSDDSGRDESLAQETKDNEELSGKIGAAAKLYSLLKPETPQAAPSIPAARITRGSVAFPGMKLASQKQRRKYFTPKGLMA